MKCSRTVLAVPLTCLLALSVSMAAEAATKTVLYSFTPETGAFPVAGPLLAPNGHLYGTTFAGGAQGFGSIFELTPSSFKVLYSFGGRKRDGRNPAAAPILGESGKLLGTTETGGTNNAGTVYRVTSTGVEQVVYSFTGGTDGRSPEAPLLLRKNMLYGTAAFGGINNYGTIFQVGLDGTETTLLAFDGKNGAHPYAGLTAGPTRRVYGTTFFGGHGCPQRPPNEPRGCGTAYSILLDAYNPHMLLYRLKGGPNDGNGPDAGVIIENDGTVYGTSAYGGRNENGAVLVRPQGGPETMLYAFKGGSDGANPRSTLVQDSSGTLYGTTSAGGLGYGTVFKLTRGGKEAVLYRFKGGKDGSLPTSLAIDRAGRLYGMTYDGGVSGIGTIFMLDPSKG